MGSTGLEISVSGPDTTASTGHDGEKVVFSKPDFRVLIPSDDTSLGSERSLN
jgi:hypothetical protein